MLKKCPKMNKNLQKTSKIDQKFDYCTTYIPFDCAQGKLKTSRWTDLKKQSQCRLPAGNPKLEFRNSKSRKTKPIAGLRSEIRCNKLEILNEEIGKTKPFYPIRLIPGLYPFILRLKKQTQSCHPVPSLLR